MNKYTVSADTLYDFLDQFEEIVGLDDHFVFDHGSSGYKAICRWAFAIMKECAKQSGQGHAYPPTFSAGYIREKMRTIESNLPPLEDIEDE